MPKLSKFNVISILIGISSCFLTPVVGFALTIVILGFIPIKKGLVTKNTTKILWPIFILLFLGFLNGFNNSVNDIFRDVFNTVKIISYFILGLLLVKYVTNFNRFFAYIRVAAFIYALLHIFLFFYYNNSAATIDKIRELAGKGTLSESLYLSMSVARYFNKNFSSLFSKKSSKEKYILSVVSASFFLYFSRSMIIASLLLSGFLSSYINIRNYRLRLVRNISIIAILLLLIFPFLTSISSKEIANPFEWLAGKFQNIPDEISWNSNQNKVADFADINDHWRGYEAFQGILKFDNGTPFNKLFGFGWGSLVDLNMTMKLAGTDYTQVPVLHNGYIMLLVKSGIIGIFLYLFYLLRIGFKPLLAIDRSSERYFFYQMLSGISLLTIVNTFTVAGLLNSYDAFTPLLLGLFWGLANYNKKVDQDKNEDFLNE